MKLWQRIGGWLGLRPKADPIAAKPISAPEVKPRITVQPEAVVPTPQIAAGVVLATPNVLPPPPPPKPEPAADAPPPPPPPGALAEAAKAKDASVVEIFAKPTTLTSTTARWKLGDYAGKEIKPGQRWLFELPPELRGGVIRTIVVAHRKDDKHKGEIIGGREQQAAYNQVSARVVGTETWKTWSDQFGSKKYAEPRSAGDPENENLHDCVVPMGVVAVDLVSLTNMGSGEKAIANVHEVVVEVFPPGKVASTIEEIYTPGTQFVDLAAGRLKPKYGGGQGGNLGMDVMRTKGLYPDAVVLGSGGKERTLSEHAYVDRQGHLHVKLSAGRRLGGLEVAIGDTVYDPTRPHEEQRNKDGHVGRLGWSKLYASLQNSSQVVPSHKRSYFMENVNVPPSGVLSGGPLEPGYVTKPGDELVVEARSHTSWLMGFRVQFMETPEGGA